MSRLALNVGSLLLVASPGVAADDAAPGFAATALPLPSPESATTTLAGGEVLVLTEVFLALHAEDGTLLRTVTTFGGASVPSQVLADPTETFALASLYGDGTYFVDLASGAKRRLTTLALHEGVFETATSVLTLSSSVISGQHEILRLDLGTGDLELVAELGNELRGMARDALGNVYVTRWGTWLTPGTWEILRFSSAQVTGGGLTRDDAIEVRLGIEDVFGGLAVRPDGSELYFGSSSDAVLRVVAGAPVQALLTLSSGSTGTIQVRPGSGPAAFLPYQPPGGGELIVGVWNSRGTEERRLRLAPARPVASVDGPGTSGSGPFEVRIEGGPPGGLGIVLFGPSGLAPDPELVLSLRVPLFLGLDPATLQRVPGAVHLDGQGALALPFVNPGSTPGVWAIQLILFDHDGRLVGSSTPTVL